MTGLFFGSFNPIHIGHLIIAQHIYYEMAFDEIWFVVSPQNPFKSSKGMLDKYERLHMVNLAIEDCAYFRSSDLEFSLPTPSYTHASLKAFETRYPEKSFSLLVGSDSLQNMSRWKHGSELLNQQHITVYPRPGHPPDRTYFDHPNIAISDAPLLDISSTDFRKSVKNCTPKSFLVPLTVWDHINNQLLYMT